MKLHSKKPKPDKEQRRHLLVRIDSHSHELDLALRRKRGNEPQRTEPPEVTEARRIVDAYEQAEEDERDAAFAPLGRLRLWLREQVLFGDTANALSVVKQFETMELHTALEAGQTMEDRNDPPLLGFVANTDYTNQR